MTDMREMEILGEVCTPLECP